MGIFNRVPNPRPGRVQIGGTDASDAGRLVQLVDQAADFGVIVVGSGVQRVSSDALPVD
ncbi:hypothetical protein MSS2_02479 [Mycobacterium marinum]|nr:hypothetical protein MSS2_02479 [Mycobacterium marinum]